VTIEVHPVFLCILSREDFDAAFRKVGGMFYQIMTDISEAPERFVMKPLPVTERPKRRNPDTLPGVP